MRIHEILVTYFTLFSSFSSFSQGKVFSIKDLDKKMMKINDSLYASAYEVTNAEYNSFLEIMKDADPQLYEECQVNSKGWSKLVPNDQQTETYHTAPSFKDFPVVNISYKGAIEYCKWLTNKYNNEKKRIFEEVSFSLPTESEIIAAALGATDKMYPWGNYYMVNKKGYYMCNFKPVSDIFFVRDSTGSPQIVGYSNDNLINSAEFPEDKKFYTMKVDSFEPNMLGIFNTSGNAAEMTITNGIAMGGSWNSFSGEIWPRSKKQYEYPSAEVGFRLFMRIIKK